MMPVLALEKVTLRYGNRVAVSDLSLAVQGGELLCLLGPSGCGKSSLIRLALGLVAPTAGAVSIGGTEASANGRIIIPPERRRLAVVFQDLALWPHLTVEKHLRFVLGAIGFRNRDGDSAIEGMLERVGLLDRRRDYPAELSGGERQRLAIARALVIQPRIVLLDEPLSNLDLPLKRELLTFFQDLFEEHHTSVVYVTHDVREAAFLATRIAVMGCGRIAAAGTLDELRRSGHPPVRDLVGGLIWTGQPGSRPGEDE